MKYYQKIVKYFGARIGISYLGGKIFSERKHNEKIF